MNTLAPQTLDCIHIKQASNWQNGHFLWHIATNSIITQSQIYLIPISDSVINVVHLKAKKEKMPESLKIENKYQPWHSIRFVGVDDNISVSNNKYKSCTDHDIESIATEDIASYTSDDDSSKLQNIVESYTPYKDSNKTSTQQTSNTWIDIWESGDEEDKETYASYPEL